MASMGLYIRQLKLGPMDNFVYLVGAEGASEVAVVDPAWEVEEIEKAASADGKTISCAVVSHCHHDHVNGLPDLLRVRDIPVYAQRALHASPQGARLNSTRSPMSLPCGATLISVATGRSSSSSPGGGL